MKMLLCLVIVSFLNTFSNLPSVSIEKTIYQSIPLNHPTMTIKSALSGVVEVIYADQLTVEVEITVNYPTANADVLDYAISADHFKLVNEYSWAEASLTLKEKRINTVIYCDGEAVKPTVYYRVKIPKHLSFIENTALSERKGFTNNF